MRIRVLVALLLTLLPATVFPAVQKYNYRVVSSTTGQRIPQFFICDTEAELPATLVADGDLAYTKDTDLMWSRAAGAWVDITTAGAGGSAHVIEDEGTPLAARANLNLTGAGVTCTDSAPDTVCDIPAGGGSGTPATTVEDETTLGTTPAVGTDTEYARQDHTHGNASESTIEGQVDLQDLQGAVTDVQVPNTITIDLAAAATTATTANAGDSATAFFPAGEVEIARGGTGQATAQAAIDALTAVAGATDEYVLTKDTATGNAIFKAAAGGGGGGAPGVPVGGLLAYWALEEASGSRADSHGTNHLADNNTVTQAAGIVGNAGLFASATSEFLNGTAIPQTGDFTVSTWFYPTTVIGDLTYGAGVVSTHSSEAQGDWVIAVAADGRVICYHWKNSGEDTTGIKRLTTFPITAGAWHHIVFRNSGGTYTIWVNGTSLPFTTATTSSGWGSQGLTIGRQYPGYQSNGRVDETGVWTRALSDTEIADVWAAGAGLGYPENILPIDEGGTGQITAQDAIDALTAVSGATNEYVLTKDTATGNATFKDGAVLKGYTVATLPTGVVGHTAYVTDALAPTYLATIVGGGAVKCPVFYNGTNWVAH